MLVAAISVGVTAAVGVWVVDARGLILAVGVTETRVLAEYFTDVVGLTVAIGVARVADWVDGICIVVAADSVRRPSGLGEWW